MTNFMADDRGKPGFRLCWRQDSCEDHDLAVRHYECVCFAGLHDDDVPTISSAQARGINDATADTVHHIEDGWCFLPHRPLEARRSWRLQPP